MFWSFLKYTFQRRFRPLYRNFNTIFEGVHFFHDVRHDAQSTIQFYEYLILNARKQFKESKMQGMSKEPCLLKELGKEKMQTQI